MAQYKTSAVHLNKRSGPGTDYSIEGTLPKGSLVTEVPTAGWKLVETEDGWTVWLSEKYLVKVDDSVVEPEPESDKLKPYRWARSKLGLKEIVGASHNAEIVSWMKLTTLPESMWNDETAWCSVFVNAAFELNGFQGTRSAMARSWLNWGTAISDPYEGCLVVFERPAGGPTAGHVAFFVKNENGKVWVVGGNQSNMVSEVWYDMAGVLGYREA